MASNFHEQDITASLKNKRKLSAFIDTVLHQYRPEIEKVKIDFIFCTDAFLLDLNIKFLAHNTLTDILTFDLSEPDTNTVTSEIYISIERVRENAAEFSKSYSEELLRVIFHGVLHLCGFKDKTPEEEANMRLLEEKCIAAYLAAGA
jgi:probable rRNA maturation factor